MTPTARFSSKKDREPAHQYFREHVNQNTCSFTIVDEKLDYLIKENYYEREVSRSVQPQLRQEPARPAYAKKFRFPDIPWCVQVLHELHG